MRPEFFGDRKDFIKVKFIHELSPGNEWAVHPLYFQQETDLDFPNRDFLARYEAFLGTHVLDGDIFDREQVVDISSQCQSHLVLDPDKGLPTPQNANGINGDGWREYVAIEELAEIATAAGRQDRLTLVYDESNPWYLDVGRWRRLAQNKLNLLFEQDVYGTAYVASHVFLIWVSANRDSVRTATQRLVAIPGFPAHRLVGEGL